MSRCIEFICDDREFFDLLGYLENRNALFLSPEGEKLPPTDRMEVIWPKYYVLWPETKSVCGPDPEENPLAASFVLPMLEILSPGYHEADNYFYPGMVAMNTKPLSADRKHIVPVQEWLNAEYNALVRYIKKEAIEKYRPCEQVKNWNIYLFPGIVRDMRTLQANIKR